MVYARVRSAYSHSHAICLHKSMLFATSNNCYIGKAHEILVLIVNVSDNRKCCRIQSGYIGAVLAISPFENIISSRLKLYLKQCRSRSTGFFIDSRHAKTYSDLHCRKL